MKKGILAFLCLILSLSVLYAQDSAVATVRLEKTVPIFGKQLSKTIALFEKQQGKELAFAERKQILDQLIGQNLILQAANADRSVKIKKDEIEKAAINLVSQQLQAVGAIPSGAILTDKKQYKQALEQQGLTVKEYEKTVADQLLVERYITQSNQLVFQNIKNPSSEEIDAEYQRRISEFVVSDTVKFNHIFFKALNESKDKKEEKRKKALGVHRQLVNSQATFAELVLSESNDEVSKARGGTVAPVRKGDSMAERLYGADFINKLFRLRVGETSTVMESNVGYHIVQITEKKAAQLLTRDDPEVRRYLENIIFATKYQETFDRIGEEMVQKLKKRATIKYFGEYK